MLQSDNDRWLSQDLANCISSSPPGNLDGGQKIILVFYLPQMTNHSLKITSRESFTRRQLPFEGERARVWWLIRWKRHFFTNKARRVEERQGETLI